MKIKKGEITLCELCYLNDVCDTDKEGCDNFVTREEFERM